VITPSLPEHRGLWFDTSLVADVSAELPAGVRVAGLRCAMSSYKETGLSIKDGAQRTHQLSGLFAARFGSPERTYLVGQSMGGFIVTSLAEKYPKQYDGVMPVCGAVGGVSSVFAYFLNERILFDYLYPGVLPGTVTAVDMPSDPDAAFAVIGDLYGRAVGALFSDARLPAGGMQIALIDQCNFSGPEIAQGLSDLVNWVEHGQKPQP
jgi:pimeloyl-ACP methyl ester carboxylesterase